MFPLSIPTIDVDAIVTSLITAVATALSTNVPIVMGVVGGLMALGVVVFLIRRFVPGA